VTKTEVQLKDGPVLAYRKERGGRRRPRRKGSCPYIVDEGERIADSTFISRAPLRGKITVFDFDAPLNFASSVGGRALGRSNG